jgi:hypothetical protein
VVALRWLPIVESVILRPADQVGGATSPGGDGCDPVGLQKRRDKKPVTGEPVAGDRGALRCQGLWPSEHRDGAVGLAGQLVRQAGRGSAGDSSLTPCHGRATGRTRATFSGHTRSTQYGQPPRGAVQQVDLHQPASLGPAPRPQAGMPRPEARAAVAA